MHPRVRDLHYPDSRQRIRYCGCLLRLIIALIRLDCSQRERPVLGARGARDAVWCSERGCQPDIKHCSREGLGQDHCRVGQEGELKALKLYLHHSVVEHAIFNTAPYRDQRRASPH